MHLYAFILILFQALLAGGLVAQTFNYTGAPQTFTVPACVSQVKVEARGGKGGSGDTTVCQGGRGGRVTATLEVTPGEVWNIYVGGAGTATAGGYNGGGNPGPGAGAGGAGSTDIRRAGNTLYHRILVAAGGGGAGSIHNPNSHGGDGGGLTGNNGLSAGSYAATNCGGGGKQMEGGAGATTNSGQPGTYGAGGHANYHGGGGGSGWFGGGGGSAAVLCCGGGGGGGGSSYVIPQARDVVHNTGYHYGHGVVIISNPYTGMPSPKNLTGPDSLCKGDSSQYSADAVDGATGYEWSVPAGVEIVAGQGSNNIQVYVGEEATSGEVSIVAQGSCGPSLPRTRTLKVLDQPLAGFKMPDSVIVWELVEFEDTTKGARLWKWDFGDGSEDSSAKVAHIYNTVGVFPVQLIVGNGVCWDTLTKEIVVYDLSGGLGMDEKGNFRLYPLPARDELSLQGTLPISGPWWVRVMNLQGQESQVAASWTPEHKLILNTAHLRPGPYVLIFSSDAFSGRAIFTKE